MTFVLAVTGTDSIWLMADGRLSAGTRITCDDAQKIVELGTTDGNAILGYSGLGATPSGMQPSEWMVNVLRGRKVTLEESLHLITSAMRSEFPKYMAGAASLPIAAHQILVTAFVNGRRRLYFVGLTSPYAGGSPEYKWSNVRIDHPNGDYAPKFFMTGSGAKHLVNRVQNNIMIPSQEAADRLRFIGKLVKAFDREKIKAWTVADHLAALNYEISQHDHLVGPQCTVVWRPRAGGGAHEDFDGTTSVGARVLPHVADGADFGSIWGIVAEGLKPQLKALKPTATPPTIDVTSINEKLSRLPRGPDEELR